MSTQSFVRRTVNKAGTWTPLEVVSLHPSHLHFWSKHIQPFIDLLGSKQRTDAGWNWHTITSFCRLTALLHQQPKAFAITYRHPDLKTTIVCALIQLVRRFPYLPDYAFPTSPTRKSGFLWLCAAAPMQALRPFFVDTIMPKRLSQLCIDIAVTCAINDGHDGRLCLHADQKAPKNELKQDILLEFYQQKDVNMIPLDSQVKIPRLRGFIAANDGRYFYFDPERATIFTQQFESYR